MKRFFIVLLMIIMLGIKSFAPPAQYPIWYDQLDIWMEELYPDWRIMPEKDRETIRWMFNQSNKKYVWFPDKFERDD